MKNTNLTDTEISVLNAVRFYGKDKKASISEVFKLPWTSTVNAVNSLLEKGILTEAQNNEKKKSIQINKNFGCFIGVSVGTSHIKVTILDSGLNVLNKEDISNIFSSSENPPLNFLTKNKFNSDKNTNAQWYKNTPSGNLLEIKNIINDICEFAAGLVKNGIKIRAVCFTFPGHIDFEANRIIQSKNLSVQLNNVGINNLLKSSVIKKLDEENICVYFDHNVKAACVAEKEMSRRRMELMGLNMAVFYMGKGLGVSFVIDNKLYRGRTNGAGNVGSVRGFENTMSLEDLIDNNVFDKSKINIRTACGPDLAEYLEKEENEKIRKLFVNYLSVTIINTALLFELDVVILSGKLADIYKCIENELQEKLISGNFSHILVAPSEFGEYSASIGSAVCAYYRYLNLPFEWKEKSEKQ